jgi:hypothetical protein
VPLTAEVLFGDDADGTDYRVVVRHGNPEDHAKHAELRFFEGWGTVTDQFARFGEH